MLKVIYILLALICIALGFIGIVLPILPTTPFFLLGTFFLAKSSKKLELWFNNTSVYKKYISEIKESNSLPLKRKVSLLITVTAIMTIGIIFMKGILIGQIILTVVWFIHIVYFIFIIKTSKEDI